MPMPILRKSRPGPSSSAATGVKLRKVAPVVPDEEPAKEQLMEDLIAMGCLGLINKPWGFQEERMVKELTGKLWNQFDNTLRGMPLLWAESVWREVYDFWSEGFGMANRKDEYIRGKFQGMVSPKDGYAVEDCIDARHRRLLQFLVPILHPEKPTRVTITLGNTIFGALSGNRKADWARIFADLVSQLFSRIGKSRATPLCPYLFHLYQHNGLLTNTEEKSWGIQESILKYGESNADDEQEEESGSEQETEEEEEEEALKPP